MNAPQFQPPESRGRYHLTPEEMERRYRRLDAQGRRCDGSGRTCVHNRANRKIVVVKVDQVSGEDAGQPYEVKSCSRHAKSWTKNPLYRVVSITPY